MDAESVEWVRQLTGTGTAHEDGVRKLHELLLRAARKEAGRRAHMHGLQGPELDDLATQAANDACVSILRKVATFRGESRFSTWAYKFVILEISAKVGRHVWKRDGVSFASDDWESLPVRLGATSNSPQEHAEGREMVAAIRKIVLQDLTEYQQRVFIAVVLNSTSMDVVSVELQTNRNAIYKALFDARKKIRRHLEEQQLLEPQGVA